MNSILQLTQLDAIETIRYKMKVASLDDLKIQSDLTKKMFKVQIKTSDF